AIEATLTGRNAELWDLNPITRVLVLASTCDRDFTLRDLHVDWDYDEPFVPLWENIGYWHPKEFLEALSRAWGYWHRVVRREQPECLAYLAAVPLLKVTRFFSYSDEKIAKLYRSKYAEEKVGRLLSTDWRSKMKSMYWEYARGVYEKVEEYRRLGPQRVEVVVKTSWREGGRLLVFDALRERLGRDVKLLVTSPPYLQAQEYIRSFKLELAWLGFTGSDLKALASREIPYNEAPRVEVNSRLYREYRSRVESLGHEKLLKLYETYFRSLAHFLNVNSGRVETLAIFVGPVKIRGVRVPIDEILREHLESLGFQHLETLVDRIVSRRLFNTRVNPATGLPDERTPTEHLLVMRRKN
ncbi:DNA methyltransferase, partial [Thermogladius sp.]|uniref:DNA methyltransferase n=1 Tax=Thermogladius sp. TaxID=2023064 RepID=UPI003D0DD37B